MRYLGKLKSVIQGEQIKFDTTLGVDKQNPIYYQMKRIVSKQYILSRVIK